MIIDRYLMREVLLPFAVVALILVAIFTAYSLTRFLTDAVGGLLATPDVLYLTALKVVIALEVLLPIAMYIGVILGLSRLYNDSEMTVLRACGMPERRLLRPVITIALGLAVLVAVLSLLVRPWAYRESFTVQARAEANLPVERIRAGRFYHDPDHQRTVFVEHYVTVDAGGDTGADHRNDQSGDPDTGAARVQAGDRTLGRLFIRSHDGDGLELVSAARGSLRLEEDGQRYRLALQDARIFRRTAQGPQLYGRIGEFISHLDLGAVAAVDRKAKALPSETLWHSDVTAEVSEFQWRLSTALSTLLLSLLAVPLSRSRPRQGKYARLLLAIAIYAVYYNLLGLARTWLEQGLIPPLPGIWWVPVGLALVVLAWWTSEIRLGWRRRRGGRASA